MDRKPGGGPTGRDPVSAPDGSKVSPASLLGELRHVYLLPDLPADVLVTCELPGASGPRPDPRSVLAPARPDTSWEQVFEHVRRLIEDDHRSAA